MKKIKDRSTILGKYWRSLYEHTSDTESLFRLDFLYFQQTEEGETDWSSQNSERWNPVVPLISNAAIYLDFTTFCGIKQ